MPKYWTKLSLYTFSLLIALTAYAPLAPAFGLQDCIALVTKKSEGDRSPHAIAYDKVKPNTYTAIADRFMQVMWPTYLKQGNVADVESELFGELIGQQIDELERTHNYNREMVEKSINSSHKDYDVIQNNFKKMGQYILDLRLRLASGPLFRYVEYLRFARIFVDIHDLEAFDKFITLKENPILFADRYPGMNTVNIDFSLKFLEGDIGRLDFWINKYDKILLRTEADTLGWYGFDNGFKHILPLPTSYPTGSFAFFSTYHLPINPIYLATEYELQDYIAFMHPSENGKHDRAHFFDLAASTRRWHLNISAVENLKIDLEALRSLVLEKNDKDLLNTFYYILYWLRFEQIGVWKRPFSLAALVENFNKAVGRVVNKDHVSEDSLVELFKNLPPKFKPASDLKTFAKKIAELSYIISEYRAQKYPSLIYQFMHKRNEKTYEQQQQLIEKFMSHGN